MPALRTYLLVLQHGGPLLKSSKKNRFRAIGNRGRSTLREGLEVPLSLFFNKKLTIIDFIFEAPWDTSEKIPTFQFLEKPSSEKFQDFSHTLCKLKRLKQ